jgi:DNA-binding CsgD family transcriptional regulator
VRVVPIAFYSGAALIYMNSTQGTASSVEILRTMFGFSPVEAEVAHLLGEGFTAKEIARARQVALNTVRSQAKQVFQKAGVRGQRELAKILSASPRVAGKV